MVDEVRTQLPFSKIKKIIKTDPNCGSVSTEGVQLLGFATERFVNLLTKTACERTLFDKRKTLLRKDLEFIIRNCEPFNFLEDALDGWPEWDSKKRNTVSEGVKPLSPSISSKNHVIMEDDIEEVPGKLPYRPANNGDQSSASLSDSGPN
ncbi:unnamed protein product [Thelazia callipaeda]|uniref:CBFD_NFYB_HMF domain-containing protein n=1 Tax=Thelazia callipaeda TaxID=103827 RepID=A0A0N5CMD9_THECL|nr:unnamed protein product [Thelazia callipaeda]